MLSMISHCQFISNMSFFNRFFNLFHRKHRFTPEYSTFSFLKKLIFFGTTGFIFSLAASKLAFSSLVFSFQPSDENRLYVKLNPGLQRGTYYPNMLMVLGIFQRLYAKYREEEPYLRMEQEQFQESTLYWVSIHDKAYHLSKKKQESLPLVLVVAGSEGIDNTIRHLLLTTYTLGYRVVALDSKDLYDVDHMAKIVQHLKSKHSKSQILGIGVEYGANLLINFAAKNPSAFEGMISIGNPFDLVKSELKLQSSWVWRELYSSILKGKFKKAQVLNSSLKKSDDYSLFELDKFTYGIKDESYKAWKQQNSCINFIKDIKVPTLFLQSREDPFTQEIDDERFENEKCIFVTTQRGGHNEWFENIWMSRWFVTPVRSFLKLVHEKRIEKIQERNKGNTVSQ